MAATHSLSTVSSKPWYLTFNQEYGELFIWKSGVRLKVKDGGTCGAVQSVAVVDEAKRVITMKGLKVDGLQQYIFTCQLDNYDTSNSFCQELHSSVMNALQFCQEVCRMTNGVVQMESTSEPSTEPSASSPTLAAQTKKRSSDCLDDSHKASKKKKVEGSFQEERNRLQEEIPEHHIGLYDIPVPLLREPPQYLRIREPKEWYVDFLVQMLSNDEDHEDLTAPLLVIASVSKQEFKDVTKGSYTYEVIGGVQRFFAISKINSDGNSKEIATRKCSVYANSLSRPAALVLARQHNEYNQIQRSTSFPEVAACCRRLLFSHFADGGNDDGVDPTVPRYNTQRYRAFKQECMTFLLSSQTSQALIDQAIQMALLKHCIYTKMQTVFTLFEEGKLRGQKQREMKGVVLQKALEGKLAPKLHHFKIFQGIDDEKKEEILDKLIAGHISMKQAESSCGALKASCAAKTMLMKEVKLSSWEEVESELPHYASMDLSTFKVQKGKPFPKKFQMLCEGAKASISPSSPGPVADVGTVKIFAVTPGCLSQHQLGSPDTLLLNIKHVSCEDELEAIIDSLCSQLKNCTAAITGLQEFNAGKILSMCEVKGAKARIFALSAVDRNVGTILLGRHEHIILAWWGPTSIPEGHLLADDTNSIVCQPSEEDTMISSFRCTSWIKLLLDTTNPQLVAEIYSESGELAHICKESGISCISLVSSRQRGMALASSLGHQAEDTSTEVTRSNAEKDMERPFEEEKAETESAETIATEAGVDPEEKGLPTKSAGGNRKKGKYPLRSQRDTQELLQELSEVEKKVQEEWYESLNNWDEAYNLYQNKSYLRPDDPKLTLGKMRCLTSMGEWTKLYEIASETWGQVNDGMRQKMSTMASVSAWGLGHWESMEEYVQSVPSHTMIYSLLQGVLKIHHGDFTDAQRYIDQTRDILDAELTGLVGESYNRAYGVMVNTQLLSEMEEICRCLASPERKPQLKKIWWKRLLGCQRNVEDWTKILQVRSLVLTRHEEVKAWVKFASICRKSGKMSMSETTLLSLLKHDSSFSQANPVSLKYPQVTFAYMKHLWQMGQRKVAFDTLSKFVRTQSKSMYVDDEEAEGDKLLARCYLKLGDWATQLDERHMTSSTINSILQFFQKATEHDRSWYKAWHSWAFMNFQALLEQKRLSTTNVTEASNGSQKVASTPGDIGTLEPGAVSRDPSPVPPIVEVPAVTYACSAVHGFFKSIALSVENSLQDTLRLLTLWFDHGHMPDVSKALADGIRTIDIDTWLQVIPQLIARIDHPKRLVSKLIHNLLSDVGKQHPQALVYPLTVATKSQDKSRKEAAESILQNMREHSSALVQQAIMVSEELIRVAILWHEQWHEGLEDASRLYFGENNIPAMFAVLQPLHAKMEKGAETLKEISFNHAYGRDLAEANEWCKKYMATSNVKDLTQAWELYYHVFRRISKQLPQLTTLELQYVSPNLLECDDLELAVPGTYEPNQDIIHIKKVSPSLNVITSKQRPRKLVIQGSNGRDFMFLLKGHEDLRQDERVMQLFGLVNTLLTNDPETFKRHLSIERYSITPLSPNSGLIGWVPHCDTIHSLIRDYRDKKKIMLNIEHRLMLQTSADYDHLMLMQKVEVFEQAIESTSGDDLAKVLWLKSPSSEVWFDRRTNYTRSLAVMSMVGYILGLGDRHPSNLMLDRLTGRILHIDFGDCFEVAMTREKFPEKIPFRLTRMLTNAMEVTGIEGNFRETCNNVMRVLRDNKDSLMAVLEAFVYDPLLNWRLIDENAKTKPKSKAGGLESRKTTRVQDTATVAGFSPAKSFGSEESQGDRPAELNKKAVAITQRVKQKLTGNDFPHEKTLDVNKQVQLLVEQATSHENLCQCYIGWCPFW